MTASRQTLSQRLHSVLFKLPLMMSCEEFEDFVLAYLDGDLSDKQRFLFELHMKVCRECRDYLTAYKAAMEITRTAIEAESRDALKNVPQELVEAIIAARSQ